MNLTPMYALVDKDNWVVGWCWETDLDKYPNHTHIKMTLENSPAHVDGKWDGTRFIHPQDLVKENA